MKLFTWTVLAASAIGLVACGPDKPADSGTAPRADLQQINPAPTLSDPAPSHSSMNVNPYTHAEAVRSPAAPAANIPATNIPAASSPRSNVPAPVAAAPVSTTDMAAPPEGASYTLQCLTITTPTHISDSMRAKSLMIQRTGSHDWYIVHEQDQSTLYYGFYKTFDDRSQAAEYARAQRDRAKIAGMADSNGDRFFPQVSFAPIQLPDPPAPAEWDIMNSPGVWTLQILVYRDNPQRKQAAVDMVRDFRKRDVMAYYHHFASGSEVYIGSWPKEAVNENLAAAAQNDDPNKTMVVFSQPVLNGDKMHVQTPDGRDVKVVSPTIEVIDPTLKQAIARYPILYINGSAVGRPQHQRDGSMKVVPFPSCLVQIPRPDAAPDAATVQSGPADNTGITAPAPTPGLGGLR